MGGALMPLAQGVEPAVSDHAFRVAFRGFGRDGIFTVGLDGLALASPAGDPDLVRLRGRFAVTASGEGAGLPLEGPFVLNPSMPYLHALYQKQEALIVHAVATPYREPPLQGELPALRPDG